ncbi:hypothetical protein LZ30DRAFT_744106, partial [Colletotrichum cereale]
MSSRKPACVGRRSRMTTRMQKALCDQLIKQPYMYRCEMTLTLKDGNPLRPRHGDDEQVNTYAVSKYDQMVLENDKAIDWWWSLLAKIFSRSQVLKSMGRVGQTVSDWVNDCLIVLASVLSGVASI